MKIKRLLSEQEIALFKENMDFSRSQRKGGGFHETEKSRLGEMHLKFGESWALFDNDDNMIAGAVFHDLATLPSSYFKPDFSEYPLDRVVEGSELWSLSPNAGLIFQKEMMILLQKRDIVCFYCYVPITPFDLRPFYSGFEPLGEPFIWPWVVTNEGEYTWCQALGLRGGSLQKMMQKIKDDYRFDGLVLDIEPHLKPSNTQHEISVIKKELKTILTKKLNILSNSLKDDENLLERGVDSLVAAEIMVEIEKKFLVELPVEFFFDNLTLDNAAITIASQRKSLSKPPSA